MFVDPDRPLPPFHLKPGDLCELLAYALVYSCDDIALYRKNHSSIIFKEITMKDELVIMLEMFSIGHLTSPNWCSALRNNGQLVAVRVSDLAALREE